MARKEKEQEMQEAQEAEECRTVLALDARGARAFTAGAMGHEDPVLRRLYEGEKDLAGRKHYEPDLSMMMRYVYARIAAGGQESFSRAMEVAPAAMSMLLMSDGAMIISEYGDEDFCGLLSEDGSPQGMFLRHYVNLACNGMAAGSPRAAGSLAKMHEALFPDSAAAVRRADEAGQWLIDRFFRSEEDWASPFGDAMTSFASDLVYAAAIGKPVSTDLYRIIEGTSEQLRIVLAKEAEKEEARDERRARRRLPEPGEEALSLLKAACSEATAESWFLKDIEKAACREYAGLAEFEDWHKGTAGILDDEVMLGEGGAARLMERGLSFARKSMGEGEARLRREALLAAACMAWQRMAQSMSMELGSCLGLMRAPAAGEDAALGKALEVAGRAEESFADMKRARGERLAEALQRAESAKEQAEAFRRRLDEEFLGGSAGGADGDAKRLAAMKEKYDALSSMYDEARAQAAQAAAERDALAGELARLAAGQGDAGGAGPEDPGDVLDEAGAAAAAEEAASARDIVIIGGHDNWVSKMKEAVPSLRFLKGSVATAKPESLRGADAVYFFTDHMGHKSYARYIGYARAHGVRVGYLHGVNVGRCAGELLADLRAGGLA